MIPPPSKPEDADRFTRAFCGCVLVAALVVHVFCATRGWHNLPVDGHEFRQAQTAMTIRYLAHDGWSLAYPTPLLGQPWAIPLEFPLHQAIAAAIHRLAGLGIAESGRLVSLLFFYAALPAVYLLARRLGLGRWTALLAPACALFTPLFLFYSRAVLIESTALCLGLWFLWLLWYAVAGLRFSAGLGAALCGALCAMVKLPTFCAFLLPALLVLVAERRRQGPRWQAWALGAGATALGLAAGFAWSAHADAIKRLNPLAGTLLSSAQRQWATGDWDLRLDPVFWRTLAHTTEGAVLGVPGLVGLVLLGLVAPRSAQKQIGALLACFFAPLLVFANVYRIHDYYYFANAAFLAGAFACAMAAGLAGARWRRVLAVAALVATMALAYRDYRHGYHALIAGHRFHDSELARAVRAVTAADDVLIIIGQDWNPVLPYLAERRALMIPFPFEHDPAARDAAYANLAGENIGALVVTGPQRRRPDLVRPVIERFGLQDDPQLVGPADEVYFPRDRADVVSLLQGLQLRELRVAASTPTRRRQRVAGTRALFSMMHPTPREFSAEFGVGAAAHAGRTVLQAHPDSELVFDRPPGATVVRAGFGIFPGAYEDPAGRTDGVRFSVLLEARDGSSRVLASRTLRPSTDPADQGLHELTVTLPAELAGDLILRTDPGPAGDRAFDWAFWTFVRIE